MGPIYSLTPLPSVGEVFTGRRRQGLHSRCRSQWVMDLPRRSTGGSIFSSELLQCSGPSRRANAQPSSGLAIGEGGSGRLSPILQCSRPDTEGEFVRISQNHGFESSSRRFCQRVDPGSSFSFPDVGSRNVADDAELFYGSLRYKTCLQTHCHSASRLGSPKLSDRRSVFPGSVSVVRIEDRTRGLHEIYTSHPSHYEEARPPQPHGISRRIFRRGPVSSMLGDVWLPHPRRSRLGVLYQPRQANPADPANQVPWFYTRRKADESTCPSRQDLRRLRAFAAGNITELVTTKNLGTLTREAQLHCESDLRSSYVSQAVNRLGGEDKTAGHQGRQGIQDSSYRSSLVDAVHETVERARPHPGRVQDHGRSVVHRCMRFRRGSGVSKFGNLSAPAATPVDLAYQRQGTFCLPRRNKAMGSHLLQEARQVCSPVGSSVGQHNSSHMDKQGHFPQQNSNDHATRAVLEVGHARLPGHLHPHSRPQKRHRRCSVEVEVSRNTTSLLNRASSDTLGRRSRLDREAQHYLTNSMGSKASTISEMRSYVRFAIVMKVQPLNPNEQFLIQYVCFLARTLPQKTILGYMNAVRMLHSWCSLSFDWSKSRFPRLHLILHGVRRVGIPPANKKKTAFGVKELLSLRQYCFGFLPKSVQRAAWTAIIVCFWGCLRSDNVVPKSVTKFDPARHVCKSNIELVDEGFVVSLDKSKTRPLHGSGLTVLLSRLDSLVELCPVRALNLIWSLFPAAHNGPSFLYLKEGLAVPLLYRDLRSVINGWASFNGIVTGKFGSQSARSGSATSAFRGGVDSMSIMRLGDWLSNTFLSYVRQDISDLWKTQMRMLNELRSELD